MSAAAWLETLGWLSFASLGVFVCVVLLNRFVPRREAALRHTLLALVLIRLVLPPTTTSPISVWGLLDDGFPAAAVSSSVDATPTGFHGALGITPSAGAVRPDPPWTMLLATFWLAGAMATAIWLTARRRHYHRLARRGRLVAEGPARAAVDRWCRLYGLRRRVRLVASRVPAMPFTLGVLRPVIVLPEALAEAGDASSIQAVVAHELAHVKRLDDLWLGLQRLVQSLFFFNPAVWITTRAMGIEREHACDQLVLASGALSPKSYGQSLLQVIGFERTSATVAAAAGTHRRLIMRIHHIAELTDAPRSSVARSFAPIALLVCALLPATTIGEQPSAAVEPEPSTGAAAVTAEAGTAEAGTAKTFTADPFRDGLSLDDLMPGAKMTAGFGPRRHPLEDRIAHHDGVDLSTGEESPVYVPRGGMIEVAEEDYGSEGKFGTVVIVDHGGGVKTFYAHLARLSVQAGDGISDGEQIGFAGNTGVSSGPHLHFEIWKDSEKVDPANIAQVLGDC